MPEENIVIYLNIFQRIHEHKYVDYVNKIIAWWTHTRVCIYIYYNIYKWRQDSCWSDINMVSRLSVEAFGLRLERPALPFFHISSGHGSVGSRIVATLNSLRLFHPFSRFSLRSSELRLALQISLSIWMENDRVWWNGDVTHRFRSDHDPPRACKDQPFLAPWHHQNGMQSKRKSRNMLRETLAEVPWFRGGSY